MLRSPSELIQQFWSEFKKANPAYADREMPVSYYFCDNKKDADECADLVVRGIKQATAPSLWYFEKHSEPLPKPGDLAIVTNWEGQPKAIIETTHVEMTPYNEITAEFAATEGEGDRSLEYWKRVHEAYYTREMEPHGDKFSEDMIIVCEHFTTLLAYDK